MRIEPPEPVDEARNVVYYLEGLSGAALADVLEELRDRLATIGVELPADVRPLRFGSWVGGDRDGNPRVTPATTREVLVLQAVHGIRLLRRLVDALRRDLSVSNRVGVVSDELGERLAHLLALLPEVEPRYRRLNAEEPYRLFLTCVDVRLALTERRVLGEAHHVPERDYADDTELLDDLLLLHRSVLAQQGPVVAGGEVERLVRTVAATGLTLGTLDVREHSAKHHHAVGQLLDRVGELSTPYAELEPAARAKVLGEELASRRPLAHDPLPLDEDGAATAGTFRAIRWALDELGPRAVESYIVSMTHRRGRRVRRRGAGPRGRPGRPGGGCRPDRVRPPARDRHRARAVRADPRGPPGRAVVPRACAAARRRPGGDAGVLRLQQGRRHHHLAVADPAGPAARPRRRAAARRTPEVLPRSRRLGRSGRRPDVRRDHGAAVGHASTARSRSPSRAR
ncbi:MAG: phosphoenolpyruvate carboxylase [Nocardioides sp.]